MAESTMNRGPNHEVYTMRFAINRGALNNRQDDDTLVSPISPGA